MRRDYYKSFLSSNRLIKSSPFFIFTSVFISTGNKMTFMLYEKKK